MYLYTRARVLHLTRRLLTLPTARAKKLDKRIHCRRRRLAIRAVTRRTVHADAVGMADISRHVRTRWCRARNAQTTRHSHSRRVIERARERASRIEAVD